MNGVAIGRIVHFVEEGEHKAAIICEVHSKEHGLVNLRTFCDNSLAPGHVTSISYSEKGEPYTWHWPEKA